jgi:ubiquinone/menaquinone biosynthesis C-methylase UbiE
MLRSTDEAGFWDRSARKYAKDQIKDMAGYERTIERTKHFLNHSDTALEIGCGTGTTALALAPHVARIVASDVSSEMITIAREKAAAQFCQNVEFTVATAEGVPGSDGSYDTALAFNVLHLIKDRAATLAKIRQLLKPGGLLISKTPCLSEMSALIRYAVPLAQIVGKAPFVSFFTAAELEAEIADAGFVSIERARHGSARTDPRIFIVSRTPV